MSSIVRGADNLDSGTTPFTNQTRQNLTASRAFSTLYTNGTTRPIFVSAWTSFSLAGTPSLALFINGQETQRQSLGPFGGGITGTWAVCGWVLPGETYQINGSGTLQRWEEIR